MLTELELTSLQTLLKCRVQNNTLIWKNMPIGDLNRLTLDRTLELIKGIQSFINSNTYWVNRSWKNSNLNQYMNKSYVPPIWRYSPPKQNPND